MLQFRKVLRSSTFLHQYKSAYTKGNILLGSVTKLPDNVDIVIKFLFSLKGPCHEDIDCYCFRSILCYNHCLVPLPKYKMLLSRCEENIKYISSVSTNHDIFW